MRHRPASAPLLRRGLLPCAFLAGVVSGCIAAGPAAAQKGAPTYANRERFGMNLSGVVDWTTEWPLVDVFKASRPWVTSDWQSASEKREYAFDAAGNPLLGPGQSVQTLMLREIGGHYPAGIYAITYGGKGVVALGPSDVRKVVKERPGRIEAQVVPGDAGILLQIVKSDPKDPIRDLHVWMPGFENARSPFHPLFRERLRPFGTLRFMDWQMTNNSPVVHWADRAQPGDARYANARGIPLERMIELANTLGANPWFCMPHQADDTFVRNFARMVQQRLDPRRKITIEYSNEVWNGQFAQARYALAKGKAQNLGPSDFECQLRYYSQRAVEIFKIWEAVFGEAGKKRLVRVLGSQSANPWVSEQVLGWKGAAAHVDALAIAPYFGNDFGNPQTQNEVAKLSVDQLMDALAKEVDGKNRLWIEQQAAVARRYGVKLVAYEGGQHLVGVGGAENNQALTDLFIAANRSPRMADLYGKHLRNWFAAGGGLYVVFSNVAKASKWGSWGVLEYQDQPVETAHKYRAVVDFIKKARLTRASQ